MKQEEQAIRSAEFISSSSAIAHLPKSELPEFALIGRSNVGKSSLINMMCGKKDLAKVSNKPGKTRLINHFLINGEYYIVDLPGYGYAGVSKDERTGWKKWFADYFLERKNLICAFVLLDSRLLPQKADMEFMQWLGKNNIPFCMVFTKADKLNSNQWMKNISLYKQGMRVYWEALPHIFITSSKSRKGRDELLWYIGEMLKNSS